MAKKRCLVTFVIDNVENGKSGIYKTVQEERHYRMDVATVSRRLQDGEGTTIDSIQLNNRFSCIADPYAEKNFSTIRAVTYKGTKWKVTNASVEYPRLILEIGGVWNG